jgi:hypothetical protein
VTEVEWDDALLKGLVLEDPPAPSVRKPGDDILKIGVAANEGGRNVRGIQADNMDKRTGSAEPRFLQYLKIMCSFMGKFCAPSFSKGLGSLLEKSW